MSNLFEKINDLNARGEKHSNTGDYDAAEWMYNLALANIMQHPLNSDYEAVARAGKAYILRRRVADREGSLQELDTVLKATEGNTTFFGRARVLEERSLLFRYTARQGDEQIVDLEQSLADGKNSTEQYVKARENTVTEIAPKTEIQNRLWRMYGVTAVTAAALADKRPDKASEYLETAERLAKSELTERLTAGEASGKAISNAYHTVADVLIQKAAFDPSVYDNAKRHIAWASELSQNPMIKSVHEFKRMMLEYNAHPDDKAEIGSHMRRVLTTQTLRQNPKSQWDKGVKERLRERMERVAAHLSDGFPEAVAQFYAT